jgi:hypothetical protein
MGFAHTSMPVYNYGEYSFEFLCTPGACDVYATIKLDETVTIGGISNEEQPVIIVWEVNTRFGRGWILEYAYDNCSDDPSFKQSQMIPAYNNEEKNISPDGTLKSQNLLYLILTMAPEDENIYPCYALIVNQNLSERKNAASLIKQWTNNTSGLDPSIWTLIMLGIPDIHVTPN